MNKPQNKFEQSRRQLREGLLFPQLQGRAEQLGEFPGNDGAQLLIGPQLAQIAQHVPGQDHVPEVVALAQAQQLLDRLHKGVALLQ